MINQRYELTGSLDLCKGKLVPGLTANWGEVTGNIENQTDLVEYVSTHGGGVAAWGSISGNLSDQTDLMDKFSSYATESWVSGQGYLVQDDLSQYATRQWVTGRGYVTQSWVESQSYLTSTALSGYATESWVTSQNYITSAYLTGYATESWVVSQSYITSSALSGYATESWVSSQNYITSAALTGYATQEWVSSQSYLTSTALSGYATESWVQSQGYLTSAVEFESLSSIPGITISNYGSELNLIYVSYYNWLIGSLYRTVTIGTSGSEAYAGLAAYRLNENGEIAYSEFSPFITESWASEHGLTNAVAFAESSFISAIISDYGPELNLITWTSKDTYAGITRYKTVAVEKSGDTLSAGITSRTFLTSNGAVLSSIFDPFVTETWVTSQGYALNTDLVSLTSRVSDIETTLGSAVNITNQILS